MYEILFLVIFLIIININILYRYFNKIPNKLKRLFYKNISIGIEYFIKYLNNKNLNLRNHLCSEAIDSSNKYEVLNPNDNSDIDGYSEMLQLALKTQGTSNIAITGTYGSGKSSFLRTFENRYKEWNYLHISLATFEESKSNKEESSKDDIKEKQHQLIERSILQQIFYKEKDKVIPFSRFKRIINIKKSSLILHSIFIGMLILYCVSIFFPSKVEELFIYDLKSKIKEYSFISWIIIILFIYYFYKVIQYITKLKISKFNIKSGELQIDNKDKTSILNEHLDEILYFFEVTSYNVVVIEDLDRFDSTEIFVKLRELNTLINNSKDVNRKVKFVYAIKDDMFKDKDRTKFFEFIVPIIPYINSTSSYLKLKEKFKEENISEDFLRNVSLRINDMRLLLNISNEYKIYKHKINSRNINQERLLAMIIYKNFYPEDFAKLHINEGEVFETFSNKTKYINIKIDELSEKIKKKDEEINEYEIKIKVEKSKSIEELRKIYIFKIFEKVNNNNFYIEGKQYLLSNIDTLIKDDEFKVIKGGIVTNNYGSKITSFEDLENKVNEEFTYTQREEIILNQKNKNLEKLKQDLQELKDKQNEIKKYTISEIAKYDSSEIFKNIGSKNLLQFLLRDGYIREDEYHNYISYFFEGGLTKKDREFVLSVKDNKPFNFEYELINKKEVINHLAPRDFEVKAILNYSLLEYMFEKNIKNDKFDNFITVLINNEDSRNFIFDYINFGKNLKKFIDIITQKWQQICIFIFKESQFTEEKKEIYFKILFDNLILDNLLKLNIEDSLKVYIEISQKVPDNSIFNDKFKELIRKLKVKYQNIDDTYEKNPAFFEFIYKENLYKLNEKMIDKMIFIKGEPRKISEEKLKISHYTTVKESEAEDLKQYIEQNINEYIENVFLQIETNTKEDEKYIVELLNNEDLEFKNKQSIIEKEEAKISDISQIVKQELWEVLFDKNKVTAIWKNILNYYQNKEQNLDEMIINFISIEENYVELSNSKMNQVKDFGKPLIEKISREILTNNNINDEAYSYIINGIWIWKFYNLDISELSTKKIDILIKNNKLKLENDNINNLKKYSPDNQVELFKNFKEEFLEKHKEFILDENDYIKIFKSTKFSIDEKMTIINALDLNIFDNEDISKLVTNIYLEANIEISNELFYKLFENEHFDVALKLLTNQIPKLEEEQIPNLLDQFSEPYSKLREQSEELLKFDKEEIDKELLVALKKKGFIKDVKFNKKEILVYRK